ncbi:MAG TPA: phosphoribosylformylglycinamidine synthase, purS protein [Thermoplasmatales archaeon]|nr:phosphoribosylformylglycinamidine synthase, purS protein [Thermoplasmatales archaeon]
MLKAKIDIRLKRGIVDPEGKNITKALNLLHFKEVKKVKVVKSIEVFIDEEDKDRARERVEEMCKKLLTNPVIHDYSIEIEDVHE